jgi:hypothetical protein
MCEEAPVRHLITRLATANTLLPILKEVEYERDLVLFCRLDYLDLHVCPDFLQAGLARFFPPTAERSLGCFSLDGLTTGLFPRELLSG